MLGLVVDDFDAMKAALPDHPQKVIPNQPERSRRQAAEGIGESELFVRHAPVAVDLGVHTILAGVMGPNEQFGGDGCDMADQPPGLPEMIEKATAEDGVETAERRELSRFQVCQMKLDVPSSKVALDEASALDVDRPSFGATTWVTPGWEANMNV